MPKDELITEHEWFSRMMIKKVYDVMMIDWGKALTRVIDKFTGDVYDVTITDINGKKWLRLHKLE